MKWLHNGNQFIDLFLTMKNKISLLLSLLGEQVSQFTDANITNNTYFDLEVSGQNLIIPKSGTTSLLFYRMNTQPNAWLLHGSLR